MTRQDKPSKKELEKLIKARTKIKLKAIELDKQIRKARGDKAFIMKMDVEMRIYLEDKAKAEKRHIADIIREGVKLLQKKDKSKNPIPVKL